jgi:HK97 family phage portal protein
MNIQQAITQPVTTLINAGKRAITPQASEGAGTSLMNALNDYTGMQFDNVADFLNYYRSNYFKTAYAQLDPFTCHQLAIGNPYITAAIDAIAEPIASSTIVGVPLTPETNPNKFEIEYLEYLFKYPNPEQPKDVFINQIVTDKLQTGMAYIECNYNQYGFVARLDRVPPYKVDTELVNGRPVYIRKDNGYIFPEGSIIPLLNPNPYSKYKGLSKLVPLFTNILTDNALMEHNLRYFVKDTLKGILSVSDNISHENFKDSLSIIKKQINDMKSTGESGHLIMHGATFQGLANTNKEMMTPDIQKANIDAISAVFHVPPHKIMRVESGNIGTGTGESQEDAMNETINNEASSILSYLNFQLLDLMGITQTRLAFKDLTKTDEIRQEKLITERINNGTTYLNEVRVKRGEEPFDDPLADTPFINSNRIPLSMVGNQYVSRGSETPMGEVQSTPTRPSNRKKQTKLIKQYLQEVGYVQ